LLFSGGLLKETSLDKTKLGKYYRTTVPESVRKLLQMEDDFVEWVLNDEKYVRKDSSEGMANG
jgi:bifunctional DNA-binding transcriptional regulator/antitoxin component of YhaV-PrlF toxin-antitoxin module